MGLQFPKLALRKLIFSVPRIIQPMSVPPLVTVIIVVWNSKRYLSTCLDSLVAQTNKDFEVVIMDNGSTDGGSLGLEEKYSGLKLTLKKLNQNFGFAVANNIGARLARGKWLVLLNTDAFPEPDWLEKLLKVAEENPEYSFFSSRQVQANNPDLIDGTGDAYHISGWAWRRCYNCPTANNGLEQKEVFSACAAAALISRDGFLETGGFDEDFFSYFEDVDLGFRLRLLGKKCMYVPDAVVHHVGSASIGKRSDFSVYSGYRNMIWTFVKNMPQPLFWLFLPLHIGSVSFFIVYLTIRGQGRVIQQAVFDALHGLPNMLAKRKLIQQNRKVTISDVLKVMSADPVEPYLEFARRNKTQ